MALPFGTPVHDLHVYMGGQRLSMDGLAAQSGTIPVGAETAIIVAEVHTIRYTLTGVDATATSIGYAPVDVQITIPIKNVNGSTHLSVFGAAGAVANIMYVR